MKIIILLIMSIAITGCSALDVVKMFTPGNDGLNIDTTLKVDTADGDINKTEDVNTNLQVGDQSTDSVGRDKAGVDKIDGNKIVNYTNDWWMIVLLVLGWVLPSPQEMWKGFINMFKGLGNFILRLFNKPEMK